MGSSSTTSTFSSAPDTGSGHVDHPKCDEQSELAVLDARPQGADRRAPPVRSARTGRARPDQARAIGVHAGCATSIRERVGRATDPDRTGWPGACRRAFVSPSWTTRYPARPIWSGRSSERLGRGLTQRDQHACLRALLDQSRQVSQGRERPQRALCRGPSSSRSSVITSRSSSNASWSPPRMTPAAVARRSGEESGRYSRAPAYVASRESRCAMTSCISRDEPCALVHGAPRQLGRPAPPRHDGPARPSDQSSSRRALAYAPHPTSVA